MAKQRICFDFDGVINSYVSGWNRGLLVDEPVQGIKELLQELIYDYEIVILTSRAVHPKGEEQVREYLDKYGIPYSCITATKLPALLYVDDRGYRFSDVASLRHFINRTL